MNISNCLRRSTCHPKANAHPLTAIVLIVILSGCNSDSNNTAPTSLDPPIKVTNAQQISTTQTVKSAQIELNNPSAEDLPDGTGWLMNSACATQRDLIDDTASIPSVTASGNGDVHFRLAPNCTMTQQTEQTLLAGHSISVIFDTSLASGDDATLTASLVATSSDGNQRQVKSENFFIEATAGDWQSHQMLTDFSELDVFAGEALSIEFKSNKTSAGTLGLDKIVVTRHSSAAQSTGVSFIDNWSEGCNERWTGEQYFANRLRDWQVTEGRLQTSEPDAFRPLRTIHRVTSEIITAPENFSLSVDTGLAEGSGNAGWSGFLIGAGYRLDYRGAALVHNRSGRNGGLIAGIDEDGKPFIADNGVNPQQLALGPTSNTTDHATLQLDARFNKDGRYILNLFVIDSNGEVASSTTTTVPAVRVLGNIALATAPGFDNSGYWFDNFTGSGAKLLEVPTRSFGPVLFASHTLSRGTLTLNAQYPPTCSNRFEKPILQKFVDNNWQDVATASIDPNAYTARFSVPNWNTDTGTPYRVKSKTSSGKIHHYEGVIKADPIDTTEYVLGVFNCRPGIILSNTEGWIQQNNKENFTWTRERVVVPHEQLLENASRHEPDMIAFVGDQIYEFDPNGLVDDKSGLDVLIEDYLWKWFQFGWSVRELTRNTPSFVIPDDHDIYQGNIWGQAGRAATEAADGGFVQPAAFVQVVQKTQSGSLPDPFDPTPVDQGIEVYYTDIVHGGVGTAVLEDRKFKTGPNSPLEKRLLGDRQLEFLDAWARDWDGQQMKIAVSQSPFAQSTTHSGSDLKVINLDTDSNGWPKSGRDAAVAALRRAHSPHISGDQHLGMTLQHGIETHNDAIFEFSGPSMLNIFPRIFDPHNTALINGTETLMPGPGVRNLTYTGPVTDLHGNFIDVKAVANPDTYYSPAPLNTSAKMDSLGIGYAIVRLARAARSYTFEAWPGKANPNDPLAAPYPDWPIVIEQADNDGRQPAGFLQERTAAVDEPVVEVVNELSGELLYAIRSASAVVTLPVFDADASYQVTLSDSAAGYREVFSGQRVLLP